MTSSISISGIGLVTALGDNVSTTWGSLLGGRFISDHAKLIGANVCSLARRAATEAMSDAGWLGKNIQKTALIVGTSKGPIESWIGGGDTSLGLSAIAASLTSLLDFSCTSTLSAACASGLHALIQGVLLLQSGEVDRALVVAAEASVHPLFLSSFERLGVLARPTVGCRPFDQAREGFLMSEAAAAVCLERGLRQYSAIDRFALGADATHMVASDPKAVTLRRLIGRVVGDETIDLIHAHGTGTTVNDEIELAALRDVMSVREPNVTQASCLSKKEFGQAGCLCYENMRKVPVYSHKGAVGHSLGAAGLIGVVLNALMHRHSLVLPNARTSKPMSSELFAIQNRPMNRPIQRSIVIASGFGGAIGVVGLKSTVDAEQV